MIEAHHDPSVFQALFQVAEGWLLAQGDEFKYEVLAKEESFNQTAVESCFIIED